MDTSFSLDLPPVPKCFQKLLIGDTETAPLPTQPWRESGLREAKGVLLNALAKESVPLKCIMINGDYRKHVNDIDCEADKKVAENDTPFSRLNISLFKLKKEMADLRHLDMSLFCQLLTLNEAIQDFKMTVHDKYSEYTGSEYTGSECTGSEYSFGVGMGSRVGSFSSLNDDTDWPMDFSLAQDPDFSSPLSDMEPCGRDEETVENASFLLREITALTERAEADFGF